MDYLTKEVEINGTTIKVKLWDSAGQEVYHNITKSYFHKIDGVLIVFDICNKSSFDNIYYWIKQINENTDSSKKIKTVIVGNKSDLQNERIISKEEAERMASTYSSKYYEISAKDNVGIDDLMNNLLIEIVQEKEKNENNDDHQGNIELEVANHQGEKKSYSYCCW